MDNSFKTFLKHTAKDFHNHSVNPPVVRASTIIFKSMQDLRKMQRMALKKPLGGHYDYFHITINSYKTGGIVQCIFNSNWIWISISINI